ncbi:MAG: hypothetical protein EHM54_01190 [Nitrospiraceae bacterium]|nr:MAG: hypothetical protein EHM54_01190 [Nitrospiraceae bacterium]
MKPFLSGIATMILGLCLLAGGAAYAHGDIGESGKRIFTKHFMGSLFDITAKANYSIEVLLDEKEYPIGKNVVGIVVHNANDEDVTGAEIAIDYRNPDTGENLSLSPEIKEKGEGLYTVAHLELAKEGRRKLTIRVKKGSIEDSVQFLFPEALKDLRPAGRYSP